MRAFHSGGTTSSRVVRGITRSGCRGSRQDDPLFLSQKFDSRVGKREFKEDIPVVFRFEAVEYLDGSDGRVAKRIELLEFTAESAGYVDGV